jgi:Cys-tRNA(Pro)/Cys-tRNA(Cys) deacylase
MRVLDARDIVYRVVVYDASRAFHGGAEAAGLLGVPAAAVYKTLVVMRDGNARPPLMVMLPSDEQLDLKLLARSTGDKRLRMATQREAERLTGMDAGGISALPLRRPAFDVCIDEAARERERVHVSAGIRGTDIELRVEDLVAVTGARYVRAVR